jgi:PIN domain nuclease of toxin-antitoxin system
VIVLDTHAWLWSASAPEELGREGRRALRRHRARGVAAISCWEVATLADRGRIELDRDPVTWMDEALRAGGLELIPLTPAVAAISARLEGFHGDPADRLIVATALAYGAELLTRDERIRSSGLVKTLW